MEVGLEAAVVLGRSIVDHQTDVSPALVGAFSRHPARKIEKDALSLPPQDRARLAERLISSLDPEAEPESEQLWLEEAE